MGGGALWPHLFYFPRLPSFFRRRPWLLPLAIGRAACIRKDAIGRNRRLSTGEHRRLAEVLWGVGQTSRGADGDAGSGLAPRVGAYFPALSFRRRELSLGPGGCGAGQAVRPEDGGAGGSQRCRRGGMVAAAPGRTYLDAIGHLGGGDCDQARHRSLTRDPWQGAHFAIESYCLVAVWLCDPMDCSPQVSSVHGISQARILEWVAISSRRSSLPRDWTHICIAGGFLTVEPPGKPPSP